VTAMRRALVALTATVVAVILVTACGVLPGVKSDAAFTGNLPRALGVGAFASQCFLLCFVSAEFTQGDTVPVDVLEGDAVRHSRSSSGASTPIVVVPTKRPTAKGNAASKSIPAGVPR
jgi:hypothetical protein